jgi:hypothetical protein
VENYCNLGLIACDLEAVEAMTFGRDSEVRDTKSISYKLFPYVQSMSV